MLLMSSTEELCQYAKGPYTVGPPLPTDDNDDAGDADDAEVTAIGESEEDEDIPLSNQNNGGKRRRYAE
jgi:hypothetical protein